ncbi:MAG TPA: hypothetical protein VFC74_09565 [Oscillospiraceae bacterium]|nr:hypothetical protein [Oscillospiraceae bacterium]
MKNLEEIKQKEKSVRETLLFKTTVLLDQLLTYVPTRSILAVNDIPVKVICGYDGQKSLLINKRPLSTADDCEWVIENYEALKQAVEELVNPEAEEIQKVIERAEELIEKVDNITKT